MRSKRLEMSNETWYVRKVQRAKCYEIVVSSRKQSKSSGKESITHATLFSFLQLISRKRLCLLPAETCLPTNTFLGRRGFSSLLFLLMMALIFFVGIGEGDISMDLTKWVNETASTTRYLRTKRGNRLGVALALCALFLNEREPVVLLLAEAASAVLEPSERQHIDQRGDALRQIPLLVVVGAIAENRALS